MGKTIKQIADELGVSKTAIRKRFTDEFKAQYVETNPDGSLHVAAEGCKLIEESLRKQAQTKFAETGENPSLQAVVETQKETISLLWAAFGIIQVLYIAVRDWNDENSGIKGFIDLWNGNR